MTRPRGRTCAHPLACKQAGAVIMLSAYHMSCIPAAPMSCLTFGWIGWTKTGQFSVKCSAHARSCCGVIRLAVMATRSGRSAHRRNTRKKRQSTHVGQSLLHM